MSDEDLAELHRSDLRRMTEGLGEFPAERRRELEDALYAFNQRGIWPDELSITSQAALEIWALVEAIRLAGFPPSLRV